MDFWHQAFWHVYVCSTTYYRVWKYYGALVRYHNSTTVFYVVTCVTLTKLLIKFVQI